MSAPWLRFVHVPVASPHENLLSTPEEQARRSSFDQPISARSMSQAERDRLAAIWAKAIGTPIDTNPTALVERIRGACADGVKLVVLDLDNLLMRPRGYLGSESQEWDATCVQMAQHLGSIRGYQVRMVKPEDVGEAHKAARRVALDHRDLDEPRMARHGFAECPLGPEALEALEQLRQEGIVVMAVTGRPSVLEECSLQLLEAAGVAIDGEPRKRGDANPKLALDHVIFAGGRGTSKTDLLAHYCEALGVEAQQVMTVDDLMENTAAYAKQGYRTALYRGPDINFSAVGARDYLEAANAASDQGAVFEYLANAALVSSADVFHEVEAMAGRRLEPEHFEEWKEVASRLRSGLAYAQES